MKGAKFAAACTEWWARVRPLYISVAGYEPLIRDIDAILPFSKCRTDQAIPDPEAIAAQFVKAGISLPHAPVEMWQDELGSRTRFRDDYGLPVPTAGHRQ